MGIGAPSRPLSRTCGRLRLTSFFMAAIWLPVELTRRRSSIKSALSGGPGSAGIRTRCFGRRNAWLNMPPQTRRSRRFLQWCKRRFSRRLRASAKNACVGWKDFVFYGHIHIPYIRRVQGMTVANTGSVSQSYDGDTRASYLVIEGESIAIRRVEYDVQSEAEELQRSGLPHADWLSRILLAGKYCPPD